MTVEKFIFTIFLFTLGGCASLKGEENLVSVSLEHVRIKNANWDDFEITVTPELVMVRAKFPGGAIPNYIEVEPTILQPRAGTIRVGLVNPQGVILQEDSVEIKLELKQ